MPRAYSLDLRKRVAGFVAAGHSRRAAAAHFSVSVSFVVKLIRAAGTSGRLEPRPSGGRRHAKLAPHRAFLLARLAAKDDITMPELAGELEVATGTTATPSSLSRWFIRNGYRFKKNAGGQRTRSTGHSRGARGMATKAPAKDAARATAIGLHR